MCQHHSFDGMRFGLVLLVSCACMLATAVTHAQEALPVAVFPSAIGDPRQKELATALDSAVVAGIDELSGVHVAARPALDLAATELALGCTPEARECLRTVAHEAGVQGLFASLVESEGAATLVTLTYFDARGDGSVRSVVRRHEGADGARRALAAVPDMLSELLRLPPRAALREPAPQAAPATTKPPAHPGVGVAPILISAVGVACLGVGAAFGVVAQSNENDYRHAKTGTPREVDTALGELHTAQHQTHVANVAFGLGAAAIAAGAAWLAVDLSKSPGSDEAAIAAHAGPREVEVVLRGELGGGTW